MTRTKLHLESIAGLIRAGIPHQQRPLYDHLVKETSTGFIEYATSMEDDGPITDSMFVQLLARYMRRKIYNHLENIQQIKTATATFNNKVSKAVSNEERNRCILGLANALGASPAERRKDRQALKRWMDKDTVLERSNSRIGKNEYTIVFLMQSLAVVAQKALQSTASEQETQEIWQQLQLEKLFEVILNYVGDERLRVAVFKCLAETIKVLPQAVRSQAVKDSTLNYIYRFALQPKQLVWIQVEALQLLAVLSEENLKKALRFRLEKQAGADDIFVRHHVILFIGKHLHSSSRLLDLLHLATKDPSPYVRQAIPPALASTLATSTLPIEHDILQILGALMTKDERHEVRAAALLILPRLITDKDLAPPLTAMFCEVLKNESHSFVLRTSFKIFRDTLELLNTQEKALAVQWSKTITPLLANLHMMADNLAVRRWAAQAINFSDVLTDEIMAKLFAKLEKHIGRIQLGKRKSFPKRIFKEISDEQLGKVLTQLAENSGNIVFKRGLFRVWITRGDRFDFRLWRFLHELLRPSPDKRQAHNHTIGRVYKGRVHAPAPIMAELTQTTVPGEPLFQASESGWRPYLPLVDHLHSCLSLLQSKSFTLYTAEGHTEIHPPRGILRRCWAKLTLTLHFSRYAQLRNWKEDSGNSPSQYTKALKKLGFGIVYSPYSSNKNRVCGSSDPAVQRFFPVFPFTLSPHLLDQFKSYFFTVYENSLYELTLFAVGLSLIFLGLRLTASIAVNRSRKRLSLVIGGWGTRGKSGVERLKAALFEGLGHASLSKSTGCEAMFLHSYHFGRNQEMFLFRPYDKATIWEHHNLIKMADKMDCSVFLWECMGLTPAYVEILQHKWSKDDMSTITNTYPDHEDIQGPAGYNIPQVMRCFIPENGLLLTTEEQMHPILIEDAEQKQTAYHQIGWLQAGLLTEDILGRFPYEEHPYNIALVVALAEQLGIARDQALKEMADRVIPDIGVLKAFPRAPMSGRTLEFVNGMSANERFATLSNWQRMDFETGPDGPDPSIVLHVLINNRADRISRSQMFGKILAEDISADRYILIGSNLAGLRGYIVSAWDTYLEKSSARLDDKNNQSEYAIFLQSMATKLRIPSEVNFILARCERMLSPHLDEEKIQQILTQIEAQENWTDLFSNLDLPYKDEIMQHLQNHLQCFNEFHALKKKIEGSEPSPKLLEELQTLVTQWFKRRIVVIEDFHATGDQVITRLCRETPPGLLCRIMGMQNIKGTGLDFVYRWQAWERCWMSCNKLEHEEEAVIEEGLNEMMAFQDYGVLCEDFVLTSLARFNENTYAQSERIQAGITLIKTHLEKKLDVIKSKMNSSKPTTSGLGKKLIDAMEALLDAGDAIKRKKIATRIYKDLANERISHQRAAMELQALNKRQKGGWLFTLLKN